MELLARITSHSPEATEALGQRLGRLLQPGQVVGLVGELGAGKTCLARGVARGLGVPIDTPVSSPTFTLVNIYQGRLTLYHVDLYRLTTAEDLIEIGLDEYYRGEGTCLVEWFDRFPQEAPPGYLLARLVVTGDTSRRLELQATDDSHRRLARAWAGGHE
jgi:tRNA threonylcarbamoyladenosine biosynthesis protein TsaE